jgi:hypothetical protein
MLYFFYTIQSTKLKILDATELYSGLYDTIVQVCYFGPYSLQIGDTYSMVQDII